MIPPERARRTPGPNVIRIERSLEIDAPLAAVSQEWSRFEELPGAIPGVRRIAWQSVRDARNAGALHFQLSSTSGIAECMTFRMWLRIGFA